MKKILFLLAFSAIILCAADVQAQNTLLYQPTLTLITNTSADTATYSFPPNRNFDYAWMVKATGVTGTDSLTVKIEETTCNTCTAWKQVGSTVTLGGTGTANQVSLHTGTLYGVRQRIIITGVGTQTTTPTLYAAFRRKQ